MCTHQHNELVCLGTIEDAVGSDCFPEVFVNVVICTAVKNSTQESWPLFIWQHWISITRLVADMRTLSIWMCKSISQSVCVCSSVTLTCPSGLRGRGRGPCGRCFEKQGCWGLVAWCALTWLSRCTWHHMPHIQSRRTEKQHRRYRFLIMSTKTRLCSDL